MAKRNLEQNEYRYLIEDEIELKKAQAVLDNCDVALDKMPDKEEEREG